MSRGRVWEHRYSQTAGRASPLKAYYVERNRLRVALKNFPARALMGMPAAELARYFWHVVSVLEGKGSAARYQQDNRGVFDLAFIVLRAHLSALFRAPGAVAEAPRDRQEGAPEPGGVLRAAGAVFDQPAGR